MPRQPKIFLAGCSSAEPASASFRHFKSTDINTSKRLLNLFFDKYLRKKYSKFEKKKSTKKRKEEWHGLRPYSFLIRFCEAYISRHNHD